MGGLSHHGGLTEDPRGDPVILHVDMDCFYAACERLKEPELEGKPVVVGMGYEEGRESGAVATASYEAREFGVQSAMSIDEALRRLPRMAEADAHTPDAPDPEESGHYRPVDMEFYREVGHRVREVLEEESDVLEPVSIDEAYLDVTETVDWSDAEGFAERLKESIEEETGLRASVGVAPTKSAAKVASDRDKPDGLVVIEPGEVREFFEPLKVEEVHGIGEVTAGRLREMGIETAGDLADSGRRRLREEFGKRGPEFRSRARGVDPRPVEPPDDPKSLSREKSLGDPSDDSATKARYVRRLAEAVSKRAREKDALYRTVGIKVVEPPFEVSTRARSLPGPVDDPDLVEEIALELLDEFEDASVRKLGVRVSNLSFSKAQQTTFDEWEGEESGRSPSLGEWNRRERKTDGDQENLSSFENC